MKAIIFGANGQDGYYLNKLLVKDKVEVIGVSRNNPKWLIGNISDFAFVENLIKQERPDFIFHLAANSTVRHDVLFENHETISTGSFNILEAAYRHSPASRIFLSGSGLQFINTGKPIFETDEFEASSPYSVSRIQSVYAARYYRSLGLSVYIGYFFHHDSPLRSERHMNMKIAKEALRIKNGGSQILEIGNIDVVKEYNYAGDIVNAVWFLVNQENVFEAVIGSGKGYAIKDWIKICFENINMDWQKFVVTKNNFKPDFMSMVSNPKTILSLGWQPQTNIYQLCNKMME